MRPAVKLVLTAEQQQVVEGVGTQAGYCSGGTITLSDYPAKAQGCTVQDIGSIVGMCTLSVHHWIERYLTEGIRGLLTKKGQGRKALLDIAEDAPAVLLSVKEHRQSERAAQAAYQASRGKRVSEDCFRAFLKALANPIKESESGWVKSRTRKSMSIQ